MPSRPGLTDYLRRPYEMVRGLCPRDWMRGDVDAMVARRGKRGCGWSGRTGASNAATDGGQRRHYADTYRHAQPVGGGVLDAPSSG